MDAYVERYKLNDKRPVYLNLLKIRLPIMGMVSFAHRISGVLLFLAIPLSVYMLHLSTTSSAGFDEMLRLFDMPIVKLINTGLLWSVTHHLFAGIRFLLIDADIGVEKHIAIRSAWSVVAAEVIVFLCLLCWIWS